MNARHAATAVASHDRVVHGNRWRTIGYARPSPSTASNAVAPRNSRQLRLDRTFVNPLTKENPS